MEKVMDNNGAWPELRSGACGCVAVAVGSVLT